MPWTKGKPFPPEMIAKSAASLKAAAKRHKKPHRKDDPAIIAKMANGPNATKLFGR